MNDLEAMAGALRASGQYRVQRRLQPRLRINDSHGAPTRLGLFVDVETTGLDPTKHEIIELGMIPFSYLSDGLSFALCRAICPTIALIIPKQSRR